MAGFIALLLLIATATGCGGGPTRAAGSRDLPEQQLARVIIPQHTAVATWEGTPVHIERFWIGQIEYLINADRAFLIAPGTYAFGVDYDKCRHGVDRAGESFEDTGIFVGPMGRFDATVEAGATYVLKADPTLVGKNAIQTRHELVKQ